MPACLHACAKAETTALLLTGAALPGAAPLATALTAIALMTAAATEPAEDATGIGHQGCWGWALPLAPSSVQLVVGACGAQLALEAPAFAGTRWGVHWGVH